MQLQNQIPLNKDWSWTNNHHQNGPLDAALKAVNDSLDMFGTALISTDNAQRVFKARFSDAELEASCGVVTRELLMWVSKLH